MLENQSVQERLLVRGEALEAVGLLCYDDLRQDLFDLGSEYELFHGELDRFLWVILMLKCLSDGFKGLSLVTTGFSKSSLQFLVSLILEASSSALDGGSLLVLLSLALSDDPSVVALAENSDFSCAWLVRAFLVGVAGLHTLVLTVLPLFPAFFSATLLHEFLLTLVASTFLMADFLTFVATGKFFVTNSPAVVPELRAVYLFNDLLSTVANLVDDFKAWWAVANVTVHGAGVAAL